MGLKKSEISVLTERYAKALYSTASNAKEAEDISMQLTGIASAVSSDEYLGRIFEKNSIDKKNIKILVESFKEKASINDKLANFIMLLNDNGRLFLVAEVSVELSNIIKELNNIIVADVYTATKLSEGSTEQIKSSLKSSFNKDIQVKEILDKSILGGLKIKIGSVLFDDSIASKINRLKLKFENN